MAPYIVSGITLHQQATFHSKGQLLFSCYAITLTEKRTSK